MGQCLKQDSHMVQSLSFLLGCAYQLLHKVFHSYQQDFSIDILSHQMCHSYQQAAINGYLTKSSISFLLTSSVNSVNWHLAPSNVSVLASLCQILSCPIKSFIPINNLMSVNILPHQVTHSYQQAYVNWHLDLSSHSFLPTSLCQLTSCPIKCFIPTNRLLSIEILHHQVTHSYQQPASIDILHHQVTHSNQQAPANWNLAPSSHTFLPTSFYQMTSCPIKCFSFIPASFCQLTSCPIKSFIATNKLVLIAHQVTHSNQQAPVNWNLALPMQAFLLTSFYHMTSCPIKHLSFLLANACQLPSWPIKSHMPSRIWDHKCSPTGLVHESRWRDNTTKCVVY